MNSDISEYKAKLLNFDKENKSRFLQKIVEYSLDATAIELPEIEYSRDNYNKYFNRGQIESPIESLKMGGNQFEKFGKEDRNNLIKAAYLTLTKPSLVIEKDSYDKVTDSFKPLHVYGKSFYRTESGNKRVVESIVVFKDENNIVIGSHNNDIDNFVKQIKTADQLIFADSEISRMITQLNKEVGNPVSLYGMNTEALNIKYDKNSNVSMLDINNIVNKIKMPEQLIYVSDEIGQVIERVTGKQLVTVNPTRVNNSVPPQVSISQSFKKSSFQSESEILSQPMTVTVNDKERVCHNGVLEGFKNAVKMIDDSQKENRSLKNENAELHKQLEANQEKSQKKSRSEGMSY